MSVIHAPHSLYGVLPWSTNTTTTTTHNPLYFTLVAVFVCRSLRERAVVLQNQIVKEGALRQKWFVRLRFLVVFRTRVQKICSTLFARLHLIFSLSRLNYLAKDRRISFKL